MSSAKKEKIEFSVKTTSDLQRIMKLVVDNTAKALRAGEVLVILTRPIRKLSQNAKFHAMISDIAKQITFLGNKRHKPDVWKALMVEQFAFEKEEMGEPLSHPGHTVMSLDGKRMISVRPSTTDFRVSEAGEFIEFLYMKGCEYGVIWGSYATKIYEGYREAQQPKIEHQRDRAA